MVVEAKGKKGTDEHSEDKLRIKLLGEKHRIEAVNTFNDKNRILVKTKLMSRPYAPSELEAEGKIFCKCEHTHEIDEEKYGFEIFSDGVLVKCRDCGAERKIPTDNSLNTHSFLDADELYLE